MLPLKNRLRKEKDFQNVYKKGQSCLFENISIRFIENKKEYSRIGFVVSAKFSKKAVERNKIKRQLRQIFQEELPYFFKNVDLVVMIKKEKITFSQIKENVKKCLKKAKIIK